jgi:elongator complex protein 6
MSPHLAMPPSTRIPPNLQPYVRLPRDDSLLLLTSTLGASANWLITRLLCDALSNSEHGAEHPGHNVVLVSWMREYDFWRQEARKGAGLDLERLKKEGRLAFVDGLSELCLEKSDGTTPASAASAEVSPQRAPQSLPVRGPPGRILPARGPPQATPATPSTSIQLQTSGANRPHTPGHYALTSLDLAHLQSTITSAVSSLPSSPPTSSSAAQRKTLLILDNPDLALPLNPTITPSAMTSLILTLHSLPTVSHVLTHIQADTPLLSLSVPAQPLEVAHHNLLVKMAHMSRRIMGVRVLDTGVARDVSGVVRVTEQRVGWMDLGLGNEGNEKKDGESGKGKEFLYQIKGDGSVKVFERGAGGEG